MFKTIFTSWLAVALAPAAFAGGYTITSTDFFVDVNDNYFSSAFDTDHLGFAGTDGNYSFGGTLQIRPVMSSPPAPANLANNSVNSTPFMYYAPLFIDLTDFTVTCNAGTGVSCGLFDLDFVVWMDFEPTSNPLPVVSTLTGTAPADFAGSYTSAIDLFDAPNGNRIDDYFVAGKATGV